MKIIKMSDYVDLQKEQLKQIYFLKEHYTLMLQELLQEDPGAMIQILRSELVPIHYFYILDWYYSPDQMQQLLKIEHDDTAEYVDEKRTLENSYKKDLPLLEGAQVETVMEEIMFILQQINDL